MSFVISINWVNDTEAVRPNKVTVVPVIDDFDESPVDLTKENGYKASVSGTGFFTSKATARVQSSHPDYTATVKDSTSGSFPSINYTSVITMTYKGSPEPPKKQVSIKVSFTGDAGHTNLRPKNIAATLLKNGVADRNATLNSKNKWTFTWKDLDGKGNWTVSVPNIENYSLKLTDDNKGNFTGVYTCTYVAPKVSVTGNVKFVGDSEFISIRPSSVQLSLQKNGVLAENATVNAVTSWSKTWNELDGEATWSVTAPEIANYSRTIANTGNIFTITYTSTYVPPKENIFAKIQFTGDERFPELRPIYVEVALEEKGILGAAYDVGSGWNWSWEWRNRENAEKCTVHFENIPNYKLTVEKSKGSAIQFTATYACTYVEPPVPDPAPGNHPTKEDYDLMYSVLYDDISAENMIDIIHILNYGDHGTSIVE